MTNQEAITILININSRLLNAKLKLRRSRRRPSEKAMMLLSLDNDRTAVGIAVAILKAMEAERVSMDEAATRAARAVADLRRNQ